MKTSTLPPDKLPALLTDLANVSPHDDDGIAKLKQKWPEIKRDVVWIVTMVRQLWLGASEGILLDCRAVLFPPKTEWGVFIDWRRQQIGYKPETVPQQALYYLLQNSHLAKVCANGNCNQQPFFFASRSNQRYCCDECMYAGQKLTASRWWREHGNAWRASRKSPEARTITHHRLAPKRGKT